MGTYFSSTPFHFCFQEFDSNPLGPYKDDIKDKDFDILKERSRQGGEKYHETVPKVLAEPVQDGMRMDLSNSEIGLLINGTLKAVGRQDLMLSLYAIDKLRDELGNEATEKHRLEDQNLDNIGFDGSAEFVAVGKNKKKRKPIITFTGKKDKNYPRYIAHRQTSSETGLAISNHLWDVLEYTNSIDSVVALTSGN